ncbi:MAG TPA: hypothetical protein VGO75_12940, partial [Gemmatimonadaceae bacterium]|nr:hypothetical protein [Gemmatimonadaceae bacterium]
MLRGLIAVLLSMASSPIGDGSSVVVTVEDRSTGKRCVESALVAATSDGGESRDIELTGKASVAVDLDATRVWQLRARTDGCWSTTATWTASGTNEITIELFSAATLQGEFIAAAGERLVDLRGSAFRMVANRNKSSEPEQLDCELNAPKWQCTVPAELAVDVRLEPQGFAPVYLWNVNAEPGERRSIEGQKLIAGASLAGWVEDPDADPLAGATVTLAPLQLEHEGAARAVAAQHRVTANARGF